MNQEIKSPIRELGSGHRSDEEDTSIDDLEVVWLVEVDNLVETGVYGTTLKAKGTVRLRREIQMLNAVTYVNARVRMRKREQR